MTATPTKPVKPIRPTVTTKQAHAINAVRARIARVLTAELIAEGIKPLIARDKADWAAFYAASVAAGTWDTTITLRDKDGLQARALVLTRSDH